MSGLGKWAKGEFTIKNPSKYIGNGAPTFRSSWEFAFCQFCDNHPGIVAWASEPMRIPYYNPVTRRNTVYVPDFLIRYKDAGGAERTELIEIKPTSQTTRQAAGRSQVNMLQAAVNEAKWKMARAWAEQNNVNFRVVTEKDIFMNYLKKANKRNR